MNPAEGGSNAAGAAAIDVHASHNARGSARCAYWIARPCAATPRQNAAGVPSKRTRNSRGCPSVRSTRAVRAPSASSSPGATAAGAARASVRVR